MDPTPQRIDRTTRLKPGPAPSGAPKPVKLTISVSPALADELRDAVMHLRSQGQRVTLTGLIVDAVHRSLTEIADHGGGSIPRRNAAALPTGPLPGRPSP